MEDAVIEALAGRTVMVYFDRHRDLSIFGRFPGQVRGRVIETAPSGIVLQAQDDEGNSGVLFFPWHIVNNIEVMAEGDG